MAVPVLRLSFGIVNWRQEELYKLERKTRKLLTIHGRHRTKAEVDLLYAPRKQGGRGLMQLEGTYLVEITKAVEYVGRKEDPLLQIVRTHQHNISSAVLKTARLLSTELQRQKRQIQDSIARKPKKNGERRECMTIGT